MLWRSAKVKLELHHCWKKYWIASGGTPLDQIRRSLKGAEWQWCWPRSRYTTILLNLFWASDPTKQFATWNSQNDICNPQRTGATGRVIRAFELTLQGSIWCFHYVAWSFNCNYWIIISKQYIHKPYIITPLAIILSRKMRSLFLVYI